MAESTYTVTGDLEVFTTYVSLAGLEVAGVCSWESSRGKKSHEVTVLHGETFGPREFAFRFNRWDHPFFEVTGQRATAMLGST